VLEIQNASVAYIHIVYWGLQSYNAATAVFN